jgi:hypothetical protein
VAYFFCRHDEPYSRSFASVLRNLAFQISQKIPDYARTLQNLSENPEAYETVWSAWKELFSLAIFAITSQTPNIYVVIDGIDEAEANSLDQFLKQMEAVASGKTKLQFLLVGRPEVGDNFINTNSKCLIDTPVLEVTPQRCTPDIEKYIEDQLKTPKMRRITKNQPAEYVQKLQTTLRDGAEGMFLWVELMIGEIYQFKGLIPQRPPKGLPDTYRQILVRLSESPEKEKMQELNELIRWITYAERPLSLTEISGILSRKGLKNPPQLTCGCGTLPSLL